MYKQISHIEDKQRILRGHELGRAVVGDPRSLFVPPLITALRPWNLVSRAPVNKHVLDLWAAFERRVDDSLGSNSLPTAAPFVGGKYHATLAIIDAITKSLRRKAGEHHRVDGTNARTGEEGGDGLPCHGKVDRDSVAFLDTKGFEYIGNAGDFVQQFSKGDLTARAWLICFVDDRGLSGITDQKWSRWKSILTGTDLVGVFVSPTVDAVVRRVQGSFGKPDNITVFKATRPDSRERPVPV